MLSFHQQPSRCTSAGRITASLLLSFLAFSPQNLASASNNGHHGDQIPLLNPIPLTGGIPASQPASQRFTLRHTFAHGTSLYPRLHVRRDNHHPEAPLFTMSEDGEVEELDPLVASSRPIEIQRLRDRRPEVVDPMVAANRENGEVWALSDDAWTVDSVPGPNITDKVTVITLAQMASNAYEIEAGKGTWEEVGKVGYNNSLPFGWEGDSLRGYVFADDTNSTIVLAIKGTSMAVFDGSGTTTNDKENDNLFGSCCCAQQGQYLWHQVCDCATATYSCNNTCVISNLRAENRYYAASRDLYSNVTALYPTANVWLTGHSLGGAVSSLLGLTYGLPTVTFEAVPDALAAGRLGLPAPPGSHPQLPQRRTMTGAYHIGHTADPVYMGSCSGPSASCTFGGYAFESVCHTGMECVYDVVGDKGWRVSITTHTIKNTIHNVLKVYDEVPECHATPECVDCALWKFYESNHSDPTTSSSSSMSSSYTKTRTRTETCKTPGWLGCLDETTSTEFTTTSSSSSSTSTCKTPGWFGGCYDATTTTTSSTTSSTTTSSSTSTCKTPGFFGGCKDKTSIITSTSSTLSETTSATSHPITSPPPMPSTSNAPSSSTAPSTSTATETCTSKEWFGFVCVDPSPVPEVSSTSSTLLSVSTSKHRQ